MIIGAVTIIAAVMMALIQHNLKKLLAYHAVSQVGYMVLGIGTATAIGIAGGLFHMVNNAIYKCCLFLVGGGVEQRTGTTELSKLGGLAKFMPVSFFAFLIASLSISGVPPFNGFVSKWMIYQGIVELGNRGDKLWIIWLVCAMFGSALTLASFMKLIHATFLGVKSKKDCEVSQVKEVSSFMWTPMVVLAGLCVLFGVWAYRVPLKHFINPAVGQQVSFAGFWDPSLATMLILAGILGGFLIYRLGNIKTLREDTSYVGGELIPQESRVTGVDFYSTVKELPPLKAVYQKAEQKLFDIYEQVKIAVFAVTKKLQLLHNGVLPTYLVWCLIGTIILFFVIVK
jgi:NADH:ubiquinone oxidoreductase subunit 5 (subunit L)/multisubunit Na+/H+ antiporter MnhA subunit